jgi:hypothetical protein
MDRSQPASNRPHLAAVAGDRHGEEIARGDAAAEGDSGRDSDHCTDEQRAGRALAKSLLRSVIHDDAGSGEEGFARRMKRKRGFVAARLDRSRELHMHFGDFLAGASESDLRLLGAKLTALADARRAGLTGGAVSKTIAASVAVKEIAEVMEAVATGAPEEQVQKEVGEAVRAVQALTVAVGGGAP